ncbi:MAG: hypothetical protein ACM31L_13000 [Actinomycetota bacterium]
MTSTRLLAVLLLPLALSACGVPDLVAYTVKEVEKSREQGRTMAQQPAPAAQPVFVARQPAEEPPPPVAASGGVVPPRESVTVETLK